MTCDPNQLLALAARFQGSDPKMLQMAILQLLCEASAGGGGGGGSISVNSTGTPIVPAATAISFSEDFSVIDGGLNTAQIGIDLTHGRSVLPTDFDIPSAIYSNVGLSLSLAAGTYFLTVPLAMYIAQDVASNITAYVQIYNQTAGAAVANSEILIAAEFTPNVIRGGMATLTNFVTLAEPSTLQIQAREAFVDGGIVTILGENQSSFSYVKIG